jgi:hypothetical protein
MRDDNQKGGATTLTVLTCALEKATATKTWRYDSILDKPVVIQFKAGHNFFVESLPVGNIRELSAVLTRLQSEPKRFVVRGEPMPGLDLSKPVLRRKRPRANTPATFREPAGGRPYAMLDFDKVEIPSSIDLLSDPDGAAAYLVGRLPPQFQDASYHWQLSSSAGMGNGSTLSGHIWFWFDRCVSDAELTYWAEENALPIDVAIFRTVQPHYTAAPIFIGMHDPLPRRSGLHIGLEDEVEFPAVELRAQARAASGFTGGFKFTGGFEARLMHLGDRPGNPFGSGFHLVLLSATASYVGLHGRDGTDVEALKARLREAILAAPWKKDRDPQEIDRYLSDEYLDDIILGAIEKFGDGDRDADDAEGEGDRASQQPVSHRLPPYYPAPTEPREQALERQGNVIAGRFRDMLRLVRAWKEAEARRAQALSEEGLL